MSVPRSPSAQSPTPSKKGPLRRLGHWVASRPGAAWGRVRPERRTLRGINLSALVVTLGLGAYLGSRLRTGEAWYVDIGIGVGAAAGFVTAASLLLTLVPASLRFLSQAFGKVGLAAFVAIGFMLDGVGLSTQTAAIGAGGIIALLALVFGSLAIIVGGGLKNRGRLKKMSVATTGIVGVAATALGVFWLTGDGSDQHLFSMPAIAAEDQPEALAVADPSQPGPHQVAMLTYGAGTDERRPEFGAAATLKTKPVNGKPFVSIPTGWRGELREKFWGFGAGQLPLNGRVWYPDGDGPFPLVLIVHGNHYMAEWSDPGYAYLGELLASRGIITVSVDENFLNSGGPLFDKVRNENDCRGWLLLEHLAVWRDWNETEGNPFQGRVNMEQIALIGHSRGGEAVYHAALFNQLKHYPEDATVAFDYGFAIQGIISIAPSDGQYKPAGRYAELKDMAFFTIQGGHDADVSSFGGDRMYRRVRVTTPDAFKASLFVYRANHGQFNTVWGPYDAAGPKKAFLNRRAYVTGEEQRQIAAVYFSAFLEVTLRDNRDYIALFSDHRTGRGWLPETPLVSRYEDASFQLVTDYEEDVDVTTTSTLGGSISAKGLVVWREGDIPLRGGSRRYDNGVFLGWTDEPNAAAESTIAEATAVEASARGIAPASYEITLPPSIATTLDPTSKLVFSLGMSDAEPKAKDYSPDGDEDDEVDDQNSQKSDGDEISEATEPDQDGQVIDLTITVEAADGATASIPLSRFGVLLPALESVFTRSPLTEGRYDAFEPTLQTFVLPLSAFVEISPGFRPSAATVIRLVFDRTDKGVVILDRVGFAK